MSFSMTVAQMKAEIKTVTRRLGWSFLKAGDVVMAVEKAQGLKKGEKVRKLYPIETVSVRREPLRAITKDDCIKEGFPDYEPDDFIWMMRNKFKNINHSTVFNRIEFKRIK
jgi:hypothetical protein